MVQSKKYGSLNFIFIPKLGLTKYQSTFSVQAFTQRLHPDPGRGPMPEVPRSRINFGPDRRSRNNLLQPGHRADFSEAQQLRFWAQDEAVVTARHQRGQHVHPVSLRQPGVLPVPRAGPARETGGTVQLWVRTGKFVLLAANQVWIGSWETSGRSQGRQDSVGVKKKSFGRWVLSNFATL